MTARCCTQSQLADIKASHQSLKSKYTAASTELKEKRAALAAAVSTASTGAAATESLTERVAELERELEQVRQSERRARTRLKAQEGAVAEVRAELEAEVSVTSGLREQLKSVEVDRDALQRAHSRSQVRRARV